MLLPHPLFSIIINSGAMKELKMVQTVANTHFCCWYIKTIEEVIKIYQNCRAIQYSLNILGFLLHS